MTSTRTIRRPADLLEDVMWLLDQDMHPALIAKQLGMTARGIHKAAWRHGNDRVKDAFAPEATYERNRAA